MKNKTIIITGGHLTPAVSVIDEIIREKLPYKIIFVGRRFPIEGSKACM
jgi:UDP-N-acetylglucosamine:LPS N-acetylglucosamine transferase